MILVGTRQEYEKETDQTIQRVKPSERPIRNIVTKLTTVFLAGVVTVTDLTTRRIKDMKGSEC
ncbi:hypothetical protein E2C01_058585 [Portunus trituberculatus]|uniref:Uncharacterized protein n=1 Tax=Portunus trituberculatus TaxID=210409 RepID=A0A5B7H5T3_PORTR|nr:hypothetical protein [Portunus trituberculatus]